MSINLSFVILPTAVTRCNADSWMYSAGVFEQRDHPQSAYMRKYKAYGSTSVRIRSCGIMKIGSLNRHRKFYLLHKSYPIKSGAFIAPTDFFGLMVSPSISQRNCCGVKFLTSSSLRGQTKLPCSSLLYKSRNPSCSQTNPLMRSDFRPQNRNRVSGRKGPISFFSLTIDASVSIPDLKSV